jgi:hypothetical protein
MLGCISGLMLFVQYSGKAASLALWYGGAHKPAEVLFRSVRDQEDRAIHASIASYTWGIDDEIGKGFSDAEQVVASVYGSKSQERRSLAIEKQICLSFHGYARWTDTTSSTSKKSMNSEQILMLLLAGGALTLVAYDRLSSVLGRLRVQTCKRAMRSATRLQQLQLLQEVIRLELQLGDLSAAESNSAALLELASSVHA